MQGNYGQFRSHSHSMLRLFAGCIFFYSLLLPTTVFSQWARSVGGTSTDIGYGIAVDASDNVYVTGVFNGTVDFDPGSGTTNLTSAGFDVFFAKYNSSGELVWAKSVGGSSSDFGYGIAVDAIGNVYVTGYFNGTVDFDPGSGTTNLTSAGLSDVFFAKYNSSGDLVWAKSVGGSATDVGRSIVLDASGNVYVTGDFAGTVDFDPGSGTTNLTSAGGFDVFFAKYNTSGDLVWAKSVGGSLSDDGRSIAVDASGNVHVTGFFNGTADFDPGSGTTNLTSGGSFDVFFAKYNFFGELVWAKGVGGTSLDFGSSIDVDASGNVYVTGYFEATADFDPGSGSSNLTSAGGKDVFFAKYNSSGELVWAKGVGGTAFDFGSSIDVDASGNVYVTGFFKGTADFDPGSGSTNLNSASVGSNDVFFAKYNSSGDLVWAKSVGGTSGDNGEKIAVDGSGNVYVTGFFQGTADFDPGSGTTNLTSAGSNDVYFAKYSSDGKLDATAPTISSVTSTSSDDTYGIGAQVNVTVNFSEAVSLSTDGTMTITLETGVTDRTVSLTSISSATSASGTYTVQSGDQSSDLTVNSISLSSGATLSDASENNMSSFSIPSGQNLSDSKSIVIDGVVPAISSTSPAQNATVNNTRVSYTLSEAVASGIITWTRTGGSADSNSPHAKSLTASELNSGEHSNITLIDNPNLVDGAIYTVSFDATDLTGNTATTVSNTNVTYDVTAPTLAISSTLTSPTNASPMPITVTFSETVTGFKASDVTVGDGTLSNFSGSGSTYTFDITPSSDGTVSVDIAANVAQDAAGNGNTAATQFSITYDATAPTVTISSTLSSPTNTSPIPITVTFSESVTGFAAGDMTITNGTITSGSFSGSGTSYSFTITTTGDGTVSVDIAANVSQDEAGNGNTAATRFSITYDTTAPIISSTAPAQDATVNTTKVSYTLSEEVASGTITWTQTGGSPNGSSPHAQALAGTELTAGSHNNITLTNNPTLVDGAIYTLSFNATDAAGNAAPTVSNTGVTYDVETLTPTLARPAASLYDNPTLALDFTLPEAASSGTVKMTFARTGGSLDASSPHIITFVPGFETVGQHSTTLDGTDLSSNNENVSSVSSDPSDILGDGTVYDVKIEYQDGLENPVASATNSGFTYDATPPTAGSVNDGSGTDIDVQVSTTTIEGNWSGFSDATSGILSYEWSIGTTSGGIDVQDWTNVGNVTSSSNSTLALSDGTSYYVSVRVTDGAGNVGEAATSDGVTVYASSPIATISSTVNSPTNTSPIPITATFNRTVIGFEANDLTLGNGTLSNYSGSGTTYTFDITPSGDGTVTVDIAASVAQDEAGNDNAAATQFSITYDGTAPTTGVVIDGSTQDLDWTSNTTSLTATWSGFSDALTGINKYEYALGTTSGGSEVVDWTDSGIDTSVTFSGLSLSSGTTFFSSVRATDLAGNTSSVETSDGITVDLMPPSVVQLTPDSGSFLPLTQSSSIVITFSEPIEYYELGLQSFLSFDLQYDEDQYSDSLEITLKSPLASMDTIQASLKNVTDLSGQVSDEMTFTFYSELLADYTGDLKVDVNDLSIFVEGWTTKNYGLELGPVSGEVPHLIPEPDSTYNTRDGMTFVRMWYWSHQQDGSLMLARRLVGEQPEISQSGHNLIISIPRKVSVGQIVLQYPQVNTNISVASDQITEERILLSQKQAKAGEVLVEFGYLVDQDQKRIVFDTEYSTRDNSTVTMSYVFFSNGQEVVSQGTKVIELRAVPQSFALHQNYPNPFNPYATILYDLPHNSRVSLVIYDILGRQIGTLVNDERIAGHHSVIWDGKDDMGAPVSTGVYIYRMHARGMEGGSYSKTHKMLLLK